MDLRVGGVLELLGHVGIGDGLQKLVGLGDGAVHPLVAGRQHDLGPERLEQAAALEAHGFRHGDDELVAAGRAGEGQADAGVAAGGLDNGGVLVDLAVALAGVDHRHADAVLDRPERVEALELDDDGRLGVAHDPPQPHERGMADALRDIVVNPATKSFRHGKTLRAEFTGYQWGV